jgi:hypothetical protein
MKWVYRNELANNIAAALATIIGLAVAAYAFAYVSFGDTYKPETRVEKIKMPKAPVIQVPVVKGPVLRELPLPEIR